MSRRKRRSPNSPKRGATAGQQHYTSQERYKSTFVRWGILAIVGSILLFAIDMIFLFTAYFPAHPERANTSSVLTILQGPLIIEGLLLLFGIGALIYGLRHRTGGRSS